MKPLPRCSAAWNCLFAAMLIAPPAMAQSPARPLAELPVPVIRVAGEGKATLAPDMALLNLGVVREARTAREALTANNEAVAGVIAAMKEAGVESRDLQTAGFSIDPRYVYPSSGNDGRGEPRIVGYRVSNGITVRVRDLNNLGAIVDRSVTLGVNSDGNIVFTNEDPAPAMAQARTEAMRDARTRAETLAEAAGVEIGPLVEISEVVSPPNPRPIARTMAMQAEAAPAVPIEAGENTYSVNVQTTWRIRE